MANATLLSWINAEVDQALKVVRDNIAKFTAKPEDDAMLRVCPEHLHQVSGALRMVGLAGATRFCEAIEGSFTGLNESRPSTAQIGVIDRAVLALKEFVADLARGQADVPLRLFPVYRDLGALLGKTDASEKDLFFPDVGVQAPPHPEPKTLAKEELPAYLHAQRARFQRGLLGWLRSQPAGLEDMRGAVDALYQVAGQLSEPQGLWWIAAGFLDGLAHPQDPEWLAVAKPLCNKIDFQMRDLAAGAGKGGEALAREVLFAVAKSKPVTPRIKEIKQLYQLETLFPETPKTAGATAFDIEFLEVALYDLHSRLEALKGAWVQYVSGEQKSAGRFRELVSSFKTKASQLGNQHLIKMLDAIALVAARLPDPYPRQNQYMVIEMASAFLLVENVIDHFTTPPADLDQQIVLMGGWLLDAAKGKSTGEPPKGLRSDITQQIGALQLRAHVAKEIISNLQHIEQVLDAFARDEAKRDTLQGIGSHLHQIHGALKVVGFERAAEAFSLCESMIKECAQPGYALTAEDMDWIAEGLSSLGFFLEPCLHGRPPAEQAIQLFFERFEKGRAAADPEDARAGPGSADVTLKLELDSPQPAAAAAAPEKAAARRPEVDAELLGIFLDEADEVLANIQAAVPLCRTQPENREALTTIRRAFHTLKGSGRMVGLMDLGEVAWEIEQVMNAWLERKEPATAGLLQLITSASGSFKTWLGQLRAGSLAGEVDGARIIEQARRLKSGDVTSSQSLAKLALAPQPDDVTVGGVTLSAGFFDIYVKEAGEHAATLKAELAAWRNMRGAEASHEFMRAAHTLASSSRTAGFAEVANLAGAIEQWVPFSRQVTEPQDAEAVGAAVDSLRAMVSTIARREAPGPAHEHIQKLHGLTERLLAAPPPPIEMTRPPEPRLPELRPPELETGLPEFEPGLAELEPEAPQAASPLEGIELDLGLLSPQPEAQRESPAVETREAEGRAADEGREKRVMRDDIDEQLLPIFLEEAQELVPQIGSDLRDWKTNPQDENVTSSLRRALHTLKGSARMAGAIRLGELTHIMESRVEAAIEAGQYTDELFAELEDKMDRLSLDIERMLAGKPALEEVAEEPSPEQPAQAASQAEAAAPAQPKAQPKAAEAPLPSAAAMLRVNADTLDHLITSSGEVAIARSRVEAELRGVKQTLHDLSDSVMRLRTQLREVEVQADSQMQSRLSVLEEKDREFDPLEFDRYTRLQELTRLMAESLNDVTTIQQAMMKNVGDTDAALLSQARISRDVQQELMRMRAVPFANLNERLYRIVRQVSRELDRKAELEIEGAEVELDRSVLERIGAPLEHMLRNALGHGIEAPAARLAAGKPETGRISVTLRQESNEIALVIADDGVGLNLDKLRRKGLEMGLIQAGQAPSEAELMQLIFTSGLSTADEITQLSGRGVGMDVVRNEIAAIGGRIDIASAPGRGTTFTIYLPLTLAVTQAVLVRAGERILAVSSAMVEQVLRLKADALTSLYATKTVDFQDRPYPLHSLQQLLGSGAAPVIHGYNSVLLLRSGIQRIALHVDELVGNEEIVVKNIGPQLARVPGVAGATVLPDGSIVLIVNPVVLAQRARLMPASHAALTALAEETPLTLVEQAKPASQIVLVVDDSLTVRKITSRLLEREGYHVLTAKDGVDALEQMREMVPGVMLVDIEMPRMDGFDLTRNVRNDPRTQGVPIIIISSRTADKHRNQAAQLGVNVFLGKPYQEAELLQHVAKFLGA